MRNKILNLRLFKPTVQYVVGVLLLFVGVSNVSAATRIASFSGDWDATATWGGASMPTAADDVIVNSGIAVTVNVTSAECNTLTFDAVTSTSLLSISGTNTLSVAGLVSMPRPSAGQNCTIAVGAGSLTAGSLLMSATTIDPNNIISISTGTATINGATTTGTTGCQFNFTDAGTLDFKGVFASTPTISTFTGSTVKYSRTDVQTIVATSYSNLTLSGAGIKTSTGVTVNGVLSLEGTATVSIAPTYGVNATLQYNTTTGRTAGVEWITPFVATGGVLIGSTGAITMNAAKVFNASVPLTINSAATLLSNNFQLTLGGNFVNNGGTFTAGSSPVVIASTMLIQNIAGFTTTGLVSMTKTAGVATLLANVNGSGFTINGTGGTLNLGASLTHTFTSIWTRTAGTVDGGSSILKIGGTTSGTTGTFTANAGTVQWTANGNQTIAGVTYNNLIFSGSGTKTLAGNTVVNATLTVDPSVVLSMSTRTLTLRGDFINNGTAIGTTGGVTIAGVAATQNIGPFTTTGTVYMTKTSGIATFTGNVNGGGLRTNGIGGTLHLGEGLTHTITGTWTRSNGTLDGGSSILKIGASVSSSGGTFTASTGTVHWYANANQSLAGVTYYNLILSGSGTKSLSSTTAVNGTLTVDPGITLAMLTRTLTLRGDLINNGIVSGTTGGVTISGTATQSIGAFTTTGTVSMTKTAGVATFNANVNGGALTINGAGGTLNLGALTHTFTGILTLTAGSLNAESSTLNVNSSWNGTGSVFNAGTGTVNFGGVAQTISASTTTFYNLIFSGSGLKTIGAITIDTGGTLTSNNLALSLNGNFINNGTFNAGSSAISIGGTATHSIAGFTTTGLVSLTKTAGTATLQGNVNGAGFTINGNGGTLNLGAGLTHTFTGTWTRSAGTLNGGSSILKIGANVSGTGGTFTASTGTVDWYASGDQIIAGVIYYNLILSGSGIKTMGTATTIAANGTLTIDPSITLATSNLAFGLNGNFVNNGTFTAGSSAITIGGTATQSIAGFTTTGTVSMTKTAGIATLQGNVNGAGLTINGNGGTLNLGTGLTHTFTGTWTRTAGTVDGESSILKIGASASGSGGIFTASTGTVEWYANGNQTVAGVIYNNLILSGTSTKTLAAATGTNATLTVNPGITLSMGANLLTLRGDLINNGTVSGTTGGVTITGTATQSIGAFTTTGTVSMTKTAGVATFTANVNGAGLTINGAGGTLNLGAGLTHTFTGVVTLTAGALNAESSTLRVNATSATAWNGNGSLFTAGTGTVIFGGVAQTLSASATAFNNLTFAGGGVKTLGSATTVNGTLTLTSGLLTLGANNLLLSLASPAVVGTFSASNMIIAQGAGTLQKAIDATGSYFFPVGDNTGAAEYTPITVDIASGTFSSAYLAVKLSNTKHPNASTTSYINRYWSVAQSGITSMSASIEGTYMPADIVGTFGDIICARWITPNWGRYAAPVASKIAATGLTAFGDFTGVNNRPIVSTSVLLLTGLNYVEGLGPSAQQSFTVSGTDLNSDITVTPTANFELSTSSGVSFVATDPIVLPVVNGNVVATTIYVRLISDLLISTIPAENVTATATGAVTKNIACSGAVTVSTNFWIGTVSTDWGDVDNWTAGYIPGTGSDVVYATVANYGSDAVRDLHLDTDRTIGSFINRSARLLVIPAAKGLVVNNTITVEPPTNDPLTGLPTVLTDMIYISSSPTLANGSLSFHNAEGSPVYASVEMYSKASWDLNQLPGSKYHWQYFGIPLRSVVADPVLAGAYVRKWDETVPSAENNWIQLNNSSTLLPFYGYQICQHNPKTYLFKGALENGDFSSGQLSITSGAAFPGQHVFANPYTAAIDITFLTFGTQTEATVYMYHTGTYNAWTSGGGDLALGTSPGYYLAVPKNLAGETSLPLQIPSMGSILVKAMTVSGDATFDVNYNTVIMNNTDLQRVRRKIDAIPADRVCTEIELKGARSADKLFLFSEPTCTRNFDNGWDGTKVVGSSMSAQLFAMEKDGNYQVNVVDDINNTDLGFQAGTDVEYTLNFTHRNLQSKYAGVYLVDLMLNKTIDITANGSQYTFEAQSTPTPTKRFKIVTRYEKETAPADGQQIEVFSANGIVFVQNISNLEGELLIYDTYGRFIKKTTFGSNTITFLSNNLTQGVYIAKAITANQEISKKIIVR